MALHPPIEKDLNNIENRILIIRGHKVMLDHDLAELYGIETKYLKRQVRRNSNRFPEDFLIKLTISEFKILQCQFGTSSWGGTRTPPFAFTEHGILMLSSVINSPQAIQVNIEIMRTFTKLREMLTTHKDLKEKIESLEKKYDHQFKVVFDVIKKLLEPPLKQKNSIGFHTIKGMNK